MNAPESPPTDPSCRSVTLRARGHAGLRLDDPRLLEIAEEDAPAQRGGIVAVAARYDPAALVQLTGRVRLVIAAGPVSDSLDVTMAPQLHRGQPLVLRRDPAARGRGIGFNASKAAADLDRALAARLADPDQTVTLTLTPLTEPPTPGTLFLVGLPIGHQADLSPRALDVLGSVDLILAEDTRVARDQLAWRGIRTRLQSCHEHNEQGRAGPVAALLGRGGRVALVSDAGMPGLSDPGYRVIRAALDAGADVTVIPGASAVLAALLVSGLPTDGFAFHGFVPRDGGARTAFIDRLLDGGLTVLAFESPQRLGRLLRALAERAPARAMAVCRDLTKGSEAVWRGSAADLAAADLAGDPPRGEFTVVIDRAPPRPATRAAADLDGFVRDLLAQDCPTKPLAKALANALGQPKREITARLLAMKENPSLALLPDPGAADAPGAGPSSASGTGKEL